MKGGGAGSGTNVKIKSPAKTVIIHDVKAEIERKRETTEYMNKPY